MTSKRLFVIGAGINQLPLIAKAKSMGLLVIALDGNADAPGLSLANRQYVVSTRDQKAAILIAREHKVDGVVSIASDIALPTLAAVAEDLRLTGLTPAAAEAATNKGKMRQRLQECSVPSPVFHVTNAVQDARSIADGIGYPLVCKPVDRAGGYGITKVFERNELDAAFERAQTCSFTGEVVLEEFMVGAQVSVDFTVFCGVPKIIGISDTSYSPPPVAIELRHIMPSALSKDIQDKCRRLTLATVDALQLDNCAGFVEIMVTQSGCKVIEAAGRLSGLAENLIQVSTGIDVTKAVIDIALAYQPDVSPTHETAVAQFYIHPGKTGVIASIAGVEAAKKSPGVQYVNLWVGLGDQVVPLKDNYGRIGRLAAVGDTRAQAIARAEYASGLLHFEMVSESCPGTLVYPIK